MSIESMMPSSHLTLCCPLLLLPPIPPSIRVFSNESPLRMRWPSREESKRKVQSFLIEYDSNRWEPYLESVVLNDGGIFGSLVKLGERTCIKALLPSTSNQRVLGSVQSLSHARFFVTPWPTAHQASLSITNSRSLSKLMSVESMMPSDHLILCRPLLLLISIFPSTRVVFLMSQLFASGGRSVGVSSSTSVLPMNTQDWSPLGWTGSPCSPRDYQGSSPTPQLKSINSVRWYPGIWSLKSCTGGSDAALVDDEVLRVQMP